MKALAFHEHGGLDKLRYQDVPDPAIGPGDVLVRVRACALNHLDLFVREGLPGFKLPCPSGRAATSPATSCRRARPRAAWPWAIAWR